MRYMKAAETGVEVAQANAAYVLERGDAWYEGEDGDRLRRMLHYHGLAADQGNVKSLLQIGDAYYYGKGVDAPDKNKSAAVYLQASQHRSAQAMFNLGMMHEHGVGLPKDLHLAKRYYDMVLSTDPKATVPVRLALWKLAAHGWLLARGGPLLERARLAYDAGGLGENATTADIAETVSLVFFGAALAIVSRRAGARDGDRATKGVTRDERMTRVSPTLLRVVSFARCAPRAAGFEPTRAHRANETTRDDNQMNTITREMRCAARRHARSCGRRERGRVRRSFPSSFLGRSPPVFFASLTSRRRVPRSRQRPRRRTRPGIAPVWARTPRR